MELSQVAAASYHYKRFGMDYFLRSVARMGYGSIELWASGPQLHLEDWSISRILELKRKIHKYGLGLACFTPESYVYPICVGHPDRAYRRRSIDFYKKHVEAAALLECRRVLVTPGISVIETPAEDAWEWYAEGFAEIARKAEREGVYLAMEPFGPLSNHVINSLSDILRLIGAVNNPYFLGVADTDVVANARIDTFESFVRGLGPDRLCHVHFADGNPGGHLVPGEGTEDMDGALRVLKEIGYKGYMGLELLDQRYVLDPNKAMEDSLHWFQRRL